MMGPIDRLLAEAVPVGWRFRTADATIVGDGPRVWRVTLAHLSRPACAVGTGPAFDAALANAIDVAPAVLAAVVVRAEREARERVDA